MILVCGPVSQWIRESKEMALLSEVFHQIGMPGTCDSWYQDYYAAWTIQDILSMVKDATRICLAGDDTPIEHKSAVLTSHVSNGHPIRVVVSRLVD